MPEADSLIVDDFESTRLHFAARHGNVDQLDYLINKCGVVANKKNIFKATAAHDAAATGNLEALVWLLGNTNCDVEDKDVDGHTCVHLTAKYGHQKALRWLVECSGASVTGTLDNGLTALHYAAMSGHVKCAVVLGRSEPRLIYRVTSNGMTPAYIASQEGHLNVVKYFARCQPAVLSVATNDGLTCLHAAAQNGHTALVDWMVVPLHRELDIQDKHENTALHLAASNGHHEILTRLLKRGARIIPDMLGNTPLHDTAQNGYQQCLDVLIEFGCDPDSENKTHNTPEQLALHSGHQLVFCRRGSEQKKQDGDKVIIAPDKSNAAVCRRDIRTSDDAYETVDVQIGTATVSHSPAIQPMYAISSERAREPGPRDLWGCPPPYFEVPPPPLTPPMGYRDTGSVSSFSTVSSASYNDDDTDGSHRHTFDGFMASLGPWQKQGPTRKAGRRLSKDIAREIYHNQATIQADETTIDLTDGEDTATVGYDTQSNATQTTRNNSPLTVDDTDSFEDTVTPTDSPVVSPQPVKSPFFEMNGRAIDHRSRPSFFDHQREASPFIPPPPPPTNDDYEEFIRLKREGKGSEKTTIQKSRSMPRSGSVSSALGSSSSPHSDVIAELKTMNGLASLRKTNRLVQELTGADTQRKESSNIQPTDNVSNRFREPVQQQTGSIYQQVKTEPNARSISQVNMSTAFPKQNSRKLLAELSHQQPQSKNVQSKEIIIISKDETLEMENTSPVISRLMSRQVEAITENTQLDRRYTIETKEEPINQGEGGVFRAEQFVDQVPLTDSKGREIAPWRRHVLARQLAEKAKIEEDDKKKVDNERRKIQERQNKSYTIPQWKLTQLEKKEVMAAKDKLAEDSDPPIDVKKLAPWQRELQMRKTS